MQSAPAAISPGTADTAPSTLRAHVVQMLKADILSGRYRPGDRLNESRIARELNISRIPVREALSQLHEQGLVMNRERRGMFVTHLGADEVQQINSLRIVLETEALRLARIHMTPQILAELRLLLEKLETCESSLMESASLDLEFHRLIWNAAGNPYLQRMLESLTAPLFAHKTLEQASLALQRWRGHHHRDLMEALTGPQADPQSAMVAHLRMAYDEPDRFASFSAANAAKARAQSRPAAKG